MVEFLKKILRKRIVLSEFSVDGHRVSVIDEKYLLGMFPTIRYMAGVNGWYSAIHTNRKYIRQPVYPEIQTMIDTWGTRHLGRRFLVLGCAGCAIPRYMTLRFPDSYVYGVESSGSMIEVADTFFLNDLDRSRILLINNDAFSFIKDCNQQFDVCFVDLFDESRIVEAIYEMSFLEDLSLVMSNDSIVMINFFGQSLSQGEKICEDASRFFSDAFLFPTHYGQCPVFIKQK